MITLQSIEKLQQTVRYVAAAAVIALACGGALLLYSHERRTTHPLPVADVPRKADDDSGDPNSVEVPAQVAERNHMALAVAMRPTREREIALRGSLAIDPGQLVHVHARFPGQVIAVASADEAVERSDGDAGPRRSIGFMDRVKKGQTLATLWSKDLGEKKSELVDVLARLRLDKQALERTSEAWRSGSISEKDLREAERQVQVGEIAAARIERTLRSWELSEADIDKIKREVDRVSHHQADDREQDSEWAQVKITAPIDGTIVEKNFTIGDLVDTTSDLLKIADLRVLNVWLHAYEEDLPALEKLPRPIPVTIRLPANPEIGELPAAIDRIGDIIDPNEHMALLVGQVANPLGDLRAGQFVTARLALAPDDGVVEVPTRALVEDGNESLVFVQESPDKYRFKPRRVSVARRYFDVALVRSRLTPEQKSAGLEELAEGERIAASETVQLKAALRQKQLTSTAEPESAAAQP